MHSIVQTRKYLLASLVLPQKMLSICLMLVTVFNILQLSYVNIYLYNKVNTSTSKYNLQKSINFLFTLLKKTISIVQKDDALKLNKSIHLF